MTPARATLLSMASGSSIPTATWASHVLATMTRIQDCLRRFEQTRDGYSLIFGPTIQTTHSIFLTQHTVRDRSDDEAWYPHIYLCAQAHSARRADPRSYPAAIAVRVLLHEWRGAVAAGN